MRARRGQREAREAAGEAVREAGEQARAAAGMAAGSLEQARQAGAQARRAAREMLAESVYATLGVGAVVADVVRQAPRAVEESFAALARRGRIMLGSAPDAAATWGGAPTGAHESGVAMPQAAPAPDTAAWDAVPDSALDAVLDAASDEAGSALDGPAGNLVSPPFAAPEPADPAGPEPADYQTMTINELRELARRRGVRGRSAMNREELIEAVRGH